MKIAASFLNIKNDLINNVLKLDNSKADYLHYDIIDGIFAKNKTRDFSIDQAIAQKTEKSFDVHLMVEDVATYIKKYAKLKPLWISFHLETGQTKKLIELTKANNIKVGLAINPDTSLELLLPYLAMIDVVLLMSVPAGYGGQKFSSATKEKISFLKKYRQKNHLKFLIQVDGGINDETIKECLEADIVVVGTYITNSANYDKQINNLREAL